MRPQWEPAQSPSDWQQAPLPQREVPPPPQRSGFSASYAVLIGVVVLVLGFGAYYLFGRNSGTGFDVKVTKCNASGSVATIGLEVHNRSSDTQTATIRVEYHDGAGKLLDTDTALVRDIGSGDTESVDQSTILDTNADASMTCKVTAVA
ncbi:FxLYD domain-containing protein [Actinoplanes sp. NPDC051513]|uniref:FxLYD domain-containing protein n=1 Tax=Actinoplanes sp. NPDC051513 TaxID=3363908 RepID=UPI003797C2B0